MDWWVWDVVMVVGVVKVLSVVYKIVGPFIRLPSNHYKRYGGGWAMVTGATDGIGYAFCEQLGGLNFNIVMVSRSRQKLERRKIQLNKKYPQISVRTIAVDFTTCGDPSIYEGILDEVRQLDVSILVNNVGTYFHGYFDEHDVGEIHSMCNVNLFPIAMLSRAMIPKMMGRERRSAIINLSSGAGSSIMPIFSHYSATKWFDDYFSRALKYQYASKIDFLSVRPLLVTSAMTRSMKQFSGLKHATPSDCVRGALRDLGRFDYTFGYWSHHLQSMFQELPESICLIMTVKINSDLNNMYRQIDQSKNKQQ